MRKTLATLRLKRSGCEKNSAPTLALQVSEPAAAYHPNPPQNETLLSRVAKAQDVPSVTHHRRPNSLPVEFDLTETEDQSLK